MLALILIFILTGITIFSALLESFYTPEDLSKMGIRLDYSPTGRSAHSSISRRSARPEASHEIPTQSRPQAG